MDRKQTTQVLVCECSSAEHTIVFSYWEGEPEVYVSIHLAKLPLWKRIAHTVKYILGHRSKYGDFDEIILGTKNYEKMTELVQHLKQ